MDMTACLEAIAAMPKTWRMTATYSDGKVQTLDQPFERSAQAAANSKRRYLGKVVHTHDDGTKVTLDSVTVTYIGE